MSARGITSWLGVNRNLRSDGGDFRFLQLPRMNPFPKLNRDAVLADQARRLAPRGQSTGTIIGGNGTLPEMTGDVIDTATTYTVSNVKRPEGRARGGTWGKVGFGLLLAKVNGGHRAARL